MDTPLFCGDRCKHVNYLDQSEVPGESEFLFSAYSAFKVESVVESTVDPGPSLANPQLLHTFHARRDRVVPLPPCRLYGAVTL